jgi:hypothetical protein
MKYKPGAWFSSELKRVARLLSNALWGASALPEGAFELAVQPPCPSAVPPTEPAQFTPGIGGVVVVVVGRVVVVVGCVVVVVGCVVVVVGCVVVVVGWVVVVVTADVVAVADVVEAAVAEATGKARARELTPTAVITANAAPAAERSWRGSRH